jgi:serine/threonine protein kinase
LLLNSYIDTDIIHGDIKPQNVLVFKDGAGMTAIKLADFGFATLATGEARNVLLPMSRPWNAPEHRFGGFDFPEAKKTEVYSFGMLCLWVLFEKSLSQSLVPISA